MNIVVKYSLSKRDSYSGINVHLLPKLGFQKTIQKKPCADALRNGNSSQFHNIHKEAPSLESHFKPATLLK